MSALTGEEDIIPTVAPVEPVDVVNDASIPMVLSDEMGAPAIDMGEPTGHYDSGTGGEVIG